MNFPHRLLPIQEDALVVAKRALAEDGECDVTSEIVGASGLNATGVIEYRSGGVVAGCTYADAVVQLSACGNLRWAVVEGELVPAGKVLATVDGDLARILYAERTLLNLLQRACGIATATRAFVDEVKGTGCEVLHTRKTVPGMRIFDISSVLAGGGGLHRVSLESAVLVKDNHWYVLDKERMSLSAACAAARSRGIVGIYVEVEDLGQVKSACEAGASRILIDNQDPAKFRRLAGAARDLKPDIEIEATGGVTLESARRYAEGGADFLSVGALTHSVKAADVALEITTKG